MRYHISGFVTSGVAMRHCCYLFCAVLRIYRVDVARQCDEICWYFHMQPWNVLSATISSFLPTAIHNFVTTGSPTGTCAGFSTSRSTWYYCRIYCYVTIIFNGYGSRPYVIWFTTSKTSSFVVVVLAALLPVVCARAISRCVFRWFPPCSWLADYVVCDRGVFTYSFWLFFVGTSFPGLRASTLALLPNVLSGHSSIQLIVIVISPIMDKITRQSPVLNREY